MKLKGMHGTCVTHAKSILKNGIQARIGGRAGSGFYLWAFLGDPGYTAQLAKDWHQWKLGQGDYLDCAERSFALLTCELEIEQASYANLNQARHHEKIRKIHSELPPSEKPAKIFDEYLSNLAKFRQIANEPALMVVEAMVPFPVASKSRPGGIALTPGVDAYIVLRQGFSELRVVEGVPPSIWR